MFPGGLLSACLFGSSGYQTILDPLLERYGKIMGVVLFVPILVAEILWTGASLRALGNKMN